MSDLANGSEGVTANVRRGTVKRATTETQIALTLTVDGQGTYQVSTGIRFFDHMLELFTRHGGFDLELECTGDLDVDQHHTVEDVGIALGRRSARPLARRKAFYGPVTSSWPWMRRWQWPRWT